MIRWSQNSWASGQTSSRNSWASVPTWRGTAVPQSRLGSEQLDLSPDLARNSWDSVSTWSRNSKASVRFGTAEPQADLNSLASVRLGTAGSRSDLEQLGLSPTWNSWASV